MSGTVTPAADAPSKRAVGWRKGARPIGAGVPVWLLRLLWRVRGKRWVRLHLVGHESSFEGLLAGRWDGHYVLMAACLLESSDRTVRLDGHVEVPAERVLFCQVLGRDGRG